jgi:hypothetical protein
MTSEYIPTPHDQIERLVREHLDSQAETVDGAEMLRRVQAGRLAPQGVIRVRTKWTAVKKWSWGLAAAAAVLLAISLGLNLGPNQANAEEMLREAQQVHALPIDRCYQVTIAADPALLEKFPFLSPHRETRLWTRGDQFWIESVHANRPWAWGRDMQGRVWFALLPRLALRFSPQDVPEPLAHACDIRSVRLETLLRDVLCDFDVSWTETTGRRQTIRATPKPGHGTRTLRGATLRINPQTRVVEELILQRQLGGLPLTTATFELVETGTQPDEAYQLEGHVEAGATILGRERMGPGKQLLKSLFGDVADKLP